MAKKMEMVKEEITPEIVEEVIQLVEENKPIEVELLGSEQEKTGDHTIYFPMSKEVVFTDGKAKVTKETAELLKKEKLIK